MALLETKKLSFTYPDDETAVIKDISFRMEKGEFLLISGPSGSGKSTFLQLLKREISPFGKREGQIFFKDIPLEHVDSLTASKEIGMIFQDPDNQIVMDRVLDELVFGLQNIGIKMDTMRKKVAEISHFFGIHDLLDQSVHTLSGGQKQLVNLASVLLMEPDILLLDEPTAQLDPVAAKNFLHMIQMVNKEFGVSIIMVEHHLDEVIPLADRMIILNDGQILIDGKARQVIEKIWKSNQDFTTYLPKGVLLYLENASIIDSTIIPLTIKEGRQWLSQLSIPSVSMEPTKESLSSQSLISLKNVDFQYERNREKILNQFSLSVCSGEVLALVGANGTGKSTLLKVMAGIESPNKGKILFNNRPIKRVNPLEIGYLPQNSKLLFIHDTIRLELQNSVKDGSTNKLNQLIHLFGIEELLDRHPYDLSGGELQKCALVVVLLSSPKLLLMDEPTKGLDPRMKKQLGEHLKTLQDSGLTIIMVTHDIEFAASFSSRCAMMFQGRITASGSTSEFFKENSFYTTVVNRITRNTDVPEVVTLEEARAKWKVVKN